MPGLCARQHELLVWGVEGGICESRRVRYERLPNFVAHQVIFWFRRCAEEESGAPRFRGLVDILAGMLYMPCPLRSSVGCIKWSLFLSLAHLLLPLLPSPVTVFFQADFQTPRITLALRRRHRYNKNPLRVLRPGTLMSLLVHCPPRCFLRLSPNENEYNKSHRGILDTTVSFTHRGKLRSSNGWSQHTSMESIDDENMSGTENPRD